MNNLTKVSTLQLYMLWKNLSTALLVIIFMMTLSKLLPFYFSPFISLACAALLYTLIYNRKNSESQSCIVIIYTVFLCLISYTFTVIILNILYLWHIINIPDEFIFFNDPFIPSLIMCPICFVTILICYLRRHNLYVCIDCKLTNGDTNERGKTGIILSNETYVQMRNLIVLFGVLSVIIWVYYIFFYIKINTNERDWYVFTWLTVIAFLFEEIYFMARYYNLYLDLKENNEIISPDQLDNIEHTVYVRYYVICGNNLYLDRHSFSGGNDFREVSDTPFQTRRSVSGMPVAELKRTIAQMSGVGGGDLQFFFGRKSADMKNTSLLRYFYFIDPDSGKLPELKTQGEWMDFNEIKRIYSQNPGVMSSVLVADITRLATIMLTSKIFDENGYRRNRIKSYVPPFNLTDLRNSNLDFQDDKWIRISRFNSDTRLYGFKRWWRKMTGTSNNKRQWL